MLELGYDAGGKLDDEWLDYNYRNSHCMKLLQWLQARGCMAPYRAIVESAAAGGHLEILQCMLVKNRRRNRRMCDLAALGGHLEVLKWARPNGCNWDAQTCAAAARTLSISTILFFSCICLLSLFFCFALCRR